MPDRRGFQLWDPARQQEVARQGGRASHEAGTAHEFTPDEARAAAKLRRRVYTREHLAEIGRRGGQKTAARMKAEAAAKPQRVLVRCSCGFKSKRRPAENGPRFGLCRRCSAPIELSSAERVAARLRPTPAG